MNTLNIFGKRMYAAAVLRMLAIIAVLSGTVLFSESKGEFTMKTLNIFGKRMAAAAMLRLRAIIAAAKPLLGNAISFVAVFAFLLSGSIPVGATTFSTTVSSTPSFTAANDPLGGVTGCGISTGSHSYNKRRFYANTTGSHTIETTSAGFDTFIALYSPSFNDTDPISNLIACDDDSGAGTLSQIIQTLSAGTQYEVVVTTYSAGTATGTANLHVSPDVQLIVTPNSSQQFNAASSPLGGVSGCGMITGTHCYDSETFFVDSSGSYSIETKNSAISTIPDTFIALYSPSFNSGSPTSNLLACNDDSVGALSKIIWNMTAGQQYELVVTSYGGGTLTGTATFLINHAPVISEGASVSVSMSEDSSPTAFSLILNATDAENDTLTWSISSAASHGAASASGTGTSITIGYTPTADYNGSDSFVVQVSDGSATATTTVSVTVSAVNDMPSFTAGANQTVSEDAGAQTVSNWATAISRGGGTDESGQTLTFSVSNDNNLLFSAQPAVSPTGTLTYTSAANMNGFATVAVTLSDGIDTTTVQTFTITVNAVNDVPSFTKGADQTVNEDSGEQTVSGWATAISKGPSDESGQTLTFNVTNSNNALFSVQPAVNATSGDLTYTPTTNINGSATVSVTLSDGIDTTTAQTFTITVTAVNDAPSFTASNPPAVNEDAGAQTVSGWASAFNPGPSDESAQTLVSYTVSNVGNTSLFSSAPSVDTSGNLTYTPTANANGTSTFDVTVRDSGGTANSGVDTSVAQTFTITVTAVNDVPSFTKGGDQTVNEDAGAQTVPGWATAISSGPNESQTLTFNLTNDNNALFSVQPAVNATSGNLTYTPAANMNGSATVTLTLSDDGGTTNGGDDTSDPQTFTITLSPLNDAPVNTAIPTFTGNMVVGQTMTAASGTWNDTIDTAVSGSSTISYAYQWQRANDSSGTGVADISGATNSTYILTASDSGKYIRVKVTGTDDGVGTPATQSTDAFSVYKGVPTVTTGTESGVGMTSATFNGTVNAKNSTSVSNIRFDYGTTDTYGLTINASPATASGSSDTAVSATPTDLGAGVTYHYRAVATVDGENVFGTDQTFTTATTAMSPPGKSLSFNGTNYVSCADTPFRIAAGTWEAWFKANTLTGVPQTIMAKDTTGYNDDGWLGIYSNGIILFYIHRASDSSWQQIFSDNSISAGVWYHVAAIWGAEGMKMYVNGVLQASTNANTSAITSAGNNFLIGKRHGSTDDFFGGQIDEVRVWNAVRTQDEIRESMNKTLAGNESGLVAYYRFDHASGTTLADHTANHYDGALVGGPAWTDTDAFNVWTGTGSDWNTAGNWSDGLPTAASNVYIPSGGTQPSVSDSASCNHLVIASGATLTINGTLDVKGNIFNSGTIAGTGTLVCSGTSAQTVNIASLANLTLNGAGIVLDSNLTVNGTLTMTAGSITPGSYTVAYGAGGTLVYNGSAAQTCGAEFPASSGPANLTINNGSGVILHASRTLSGALTLTSGAFLIGANTLTLNGGISGGGTLTGGNTSNLIIGGTGNTTLPANALTLNDLALNRSGAVVTLGNDLTVKGALTLTSGILKPDTHNFIFGEDAAVAGSPSASAMILADSTGEVRKMYADDVTLPVSFTFPVGSDSGTPEYSPVTLEFTDGSFTSAYMALKLTDSQYAEKDDASLSDYIERYWTLTQSGISGFSCDVSFDYVPADIQGDETKIYGKRYDGSAWTTLDQAGSSRFAGTVAAFGDFTGADHTPVLAAPLADVTVYEDAAPTAVSLSSVFSDFDDDNLLLAKSVVSNTNPGLVSAAVSGETLTLSYTPNGNGSATVVIRGTANGKYAEDSFTVTVIPVDDAPVVSQKIADVTVSEDAPPTVISLSNVFADIDSASIVKSVLSNSGFGLLSAAVEGDILTLTYLKDQSSIADIVIRGTADGQNVDVSFKVTVKPVDDLPVWISEIEDLKMTDGAPDTVIDLAGRVTDVDSDETKIVFSAKSANTSLLSAFVAGTSLTLRYSKDRAGESEVTVTAISGGKTVSDTFSVTVGPLRYPVSGTLSYFSNGASVPGIKMMLRGNDSYTGGAVSEDTVTDASGNYLFSDIIRGEYTVTPFKNDPPDPKKLTAADASVIVDVALGSKKLTPLLYRSADVTLNGRVSGLDASRLARFTAGLITEMSGSGAPTPGWISDPESLSFSLNADTANLNFTMYMSGDISGNYTPGAGRSPREPGQTAEISATQGSVLSVPIVVHEDTEFHGIDIDIEYDETVLSAREATLNGSVLNDRDYETAVNLTEPGRIRMAVFASSGKKITGSGIAVMLRFDVIGTVDSSSLLMFTRFDCNEIRVSEGHNGEREETIIGGFYADGTVSDSLQISVVPADASDPMNYDMNGDRRIDMRDVFAALREGYLEGAIRSLQILTGK